MEPTKPTLMTVSLDDPKSVRAWSGTTRQMVNALSREFSETYSAGPVRSDWLRVAFKLNALSRRLLGKETLPHFSARVVREYSNCVDQHRKRFNPDFVFAPVGAILLDGLPKDAKIIYASDATVALLFDYYPAFTNVTRRARRAAERLERNAIRRAGVLLYSTRWAANSAIRDFGADPDKILVAPYGANIDDPPDDLEVAEAIDLRRARDSVNLVLVGVNWRSKGCDVAVECLRSLRGRGVDARLTIIGCKPPGGIDADGLTIIPFLDKSRPEDAAKFRQVFLEADFMVLPTRNECSAIVFSEACAFGVPSFASATGGVPEIVREGVNGHTLPLEADGLDYADAIERALGESGGYETLARGSRRLFAEEYNWKVWGERNLAFIRERMM